MIVEIDENSGFCFGVVRAIELAEDALLKYKQVSCLGDIVHNKMEVQRLKSLGLNTIDFDDLSSMPSGEKVMVRAHGEPPETFHQAAENHIDIIDATCPVVERLQRKVFKAHEQMKKEGGSVVILGKRGHAEVVGLLGQIGGDAIVVENIHELMDVDLSRPIYLLSQTTQSLELLGEMRKVLMAHAVNPIIDDTICRNVSNREPHLREFARKYDVIIFVSGRKSSNGKVLFQQCLSVNPQTYMIEDEDDIDLDWFENCNSVGICGATSTPKWLMERVAGVINELM